MDETTRKRILFIISLSLGALIITGGFLFFINKDATTPLDQILYMYNNPPAEQTPKVLTVYFFYGEECPYCHETKPFVQELSLKRTDVNFQILEIWHNETNKNLAKKMLADLGQQYRGVPLVIVENTTLIGSIDIPEQLEGIVINKTGRK